MPTKVMPPHLPYKEMWRRVLLNAAVGILDMIEQHPPEQLVPHQIYITFDTTRPDSHIPAMLKAKHPKEITLVFEHQYYDFHVNHAARLVSFKLVFGGVLYPLSFSFDAIKSITDRCGEVVRDKDGNESYLPITLYEAMPSEDTSSQTEKVVEEPATKTEGSNVVKVTFGRKS